MTAHATTAARPSPLPAWWPAATVGVLTLLGFLLRLHGYASSLLGDEMSTLWVVQNHSFTGIISTVASDAEITPPLYFLLAWAAMKLGSAPELVRLPALIAGTACIPLVYVLGLRTVGRTAALIGTALITLSPFLTYFSNDGRAYTVMVALLIGSSLAMLAAIRTGRTRWWVVYGACSCLAMYSHYTCVFVLGAQFLWIVFAHPECRKQALLANVGAAALFAPWIPSLIADTHSPTVKIMEALQGHGFGAKRVMVERWVMGHPLLDPEVLPGKPALVLVAGGIVIATLAVVAKWLRSGTGRARRPGIPPNVVLILILALATPVGAALAGLAGTDLFGDRNLTASWSGLPLAIGAVLAASGPAIGIACTIAVLTGFGIGAGKMLGSEAASIDFRGAAESIEARARPGDVVVDRFSAFATPVPQTPLDLYLPQTRPEYRLQMPTSPPPFLPFTSNVPSPEKMLHTAFRRADGHRVFFVVPYEATFRPKRGDRLFGRRAVAVPKGWEVASKREFAGLRPLYLITLKSTPDRKPASSNGGRGSGT